ncbi:hypothetical protein [Variovorax sp. dw_954]|nr:hypothetical protein [Variovorax sp. dw_954]
MSEAGGHRFSWSHGANLVADGEVRHAYLNALRTADAGDLTRLMAFVRSG